jgi:hypothetical protein
MAKGRANTADAEAALVVTVQDKIAGCLALIATKGMDTDDAALKLDGIGFTAREIAGLLDVGENYVNVARHRKKPGGRKGRAKAR